MESIAFEISRKQKAPDLLPKMSAPGVLPNDRVPGCLSHLFGNPAVRLRIELRRTRGFASPDCSGFALSENLLAVKRREGHLCKLAPA
jgi:hypothetical protein